MKKINLFLLSLVLFMSLNACSANSVKTVPAAAESVSAVPASSALPSWNDAQVKSNIIAYVKEVTDKTSAKFIPIEDRIAVFDNDGTLWAERPVVQLLYINEKLSEKIAKEPSLKNKEPYKTILSGDMEALLKMDMQEVIKVISETMTGMSSEEYAKDVEQFFEKGKYPKLNVSFDKIIYKPQIELISFLQANGFQVYICSGGDTEFMRVVSGKYYNIPKENIIGSSFSAKYDATKNIIVRQSNAMTNNDKEMKPVNIEQKIGKVPVFACGNVGNFGDMDMLLYSQSSKYKSFQMLVNHDDAQREFEYGEQGDVSLKTAEKQKWNIISMKNDWKEIF